jgi:hypothetical protein
LLIQYWNIFHFSDFYLINKTFTFKLFLSGNKFGFAGYIWACLSANITMQNVVTGIINVPQKLWLPDIVEFMHFSFRTRTVITILASYFCRCCIRQASFMISWFNEFIVSEKFCMKVLFFAHRGHLQVFKVRDLKLLCLSELCILKIPENQCQNLN